MYKSVVIAFCFGNHNNQYKSLAVVSGTCKPTGACKQEIGLDKLTRDITIPFNLKRCDEGRNVR